MGVIAAEKGKYIEADKSLRAALPNLKDNPAMNGTALFYLGLADYQLGKMTLDKAKMLDAAKYSQASAAIPGPYAQRAWTNAQLIKDEAAKMR